MDSGAAFRRAEWSWPSGMASNSAEHTKSEDATNATPFSSSTDGSGPSEKAPHHEPEEAQAPPPRERRYKPRTCRICLDVVEPTFDLDEGSLGAAATGLFRARPRVKYVSDDAELGRLISPCKCKGSQKYVHEGCLQAWRQASPLSDRNFWRCPTCGFQYRLERLRWGRWISGWPARAALTLLIFVFSVFALGFVADPIINLWLNPLGSITDALLDDVVDVGVLREELDVEDPNTWSFHFFKGVLSLGFLGFLKTFFSLFPWQWTIHRYIGGGGRRRGTGRDRLENINWGLVIVGVITFLAAVWKAISYLSAWALERASEKVVDVQLDGPDEDEDESEDEAVNTAGDESKKDK